jgi:glycyl-tRNA synthetase beta chain
VLDESGRITNHFIAVNNTRLKDPDLSVRGHEKVLKARLEDARFYFNEDRQRPLIDRLEALKGVVFHSRLGTSYEKVVRMGHLASILARRFAPDRIPDVEMAAQLAKCDLETGIVYEFPELQGIIGSYYARMDGATEDVAEAIREHYLPAHAGDDPPKGIVASIVSCADRIDTIAGCFSVGMIPTGTADPYALRRNALGVIQILINVGKPLDLPEIVTEAVGLMGERRTKETKEIVGEVMEFIRTRFVNFHVSKGYPLDVVEAAVRAGFDDVVDARARVEALALWKEREDVESIIVGFKRAANILKDTERTEVSETMLKEKAEKDLFQKADQVEKEVNDLISKGDYTRVLTIMSGLKDPIDRFFDHVMVMVEDEKLRNNRLGLLRKVAGMFSNVADFSFIGSTANKDKS